MTINLPKFSSFLFVMCLGFWTKPLNVAALVLLLAPIGGLAQNDVSSLFEVTREDAFAPLPSESSLLSEEIYAAIEQAGDDHEFTISAYTERYESAIEKGDCDDMVVAAALVNRARKKLGKTEAFGSAFATSTCSEFCAPFFYFPSLIEFGAGRYTQSLALLKKALPLCSTQEERVNVLMTIGACANGLGEVAESVKFAQWAYEQSPKPVSWKLVVNISSNLMGLGRTDEAIAILTEHLAVAEEIHPAVWLNKMQGHAMSGQVDSVWTAWRQAETLLPPLPWNPMILRALSSTAVLMPTASFWNEIQDRAWASAEEMDLAQIFDQEDLRGLLFPQVTHNLEGLITADSMRWRVASQLHRQMDVAQLESEKSVRRALSTSEAKELLSRVNGDANTTEWPLWLLSLGVVGVLALVGWQRRQHRSKITGSVLAAEESGSENPADHHPLLPALQYRIEQNIRTNVLLTSSHDDLVHTLREKSSLLSDTILPQTDVHQIEGTELDILVLTLLGISTKTIAQICNVSVGHIYNIRTQLRNKLGPDALTLSHWL